MNSDKIDCIAYNVKRCTYFLCPEFEMLMLILLYTYYVCFDLLQNLEKKIKRCKGVRRKIMEFVKKKFIKQSIQIKRKQKN